VRRCGEGDETRDRAAEGPDGVRSGLFARRPSRRPRALDQLGVVSGSTVLINGASGSVGRAAVQLGVARVARVIGSGSPATHDFLRSLRAEPIAYGDGMAEPVPALAPDGVELALDVAGSAVRDELIELADDPEHVVTIADFAGAQRYDVRLIRGDSGRAI
jgi:NADPH:quinone reductase-like Zn-dependent oxidoreductase